MIQGRVVDMDTREDLTESAKSESSQGIDRRGGYDQADHIFPGRAGL